MTGVSPADEATLRNPLVILTVARLAADTAEVAPLRLPLALLYGAMYPLPINWLMTRPMSKRVHR